MYICSINYIKTESLSYSVIKTREESWDLFFEVKEFSDLLSPGIQIEVCLKFIQILTKQAENRYLTLNTTKIGNGNCSVSIHNNKSSKNILEFIVATHERLSSL